MIDIRVLSESDKKASANFKNIFQQLKQQDGIVQKDIADKMNVTIAAISKFMNGERAMTNEFVYRLSEVLNVSPLDIKPDFDLVTYSINLQLSNLNLQQKQSVLSFINDLTK